MDMSLFMVQLTFLSSIIVIVMSSIITAAILVGLFWLINGYYVNKAKDESDGEKYEAVVLTNKYFKDKYFIYLSGIMFLIMYLKKNKIPYKLMKKFDKKKFQEFIYDNSCHGLYIIGHGIRHGLNIDKNEILYYCSFKGAPPKKFVKQLHCNNFGGESLADIIAPNKDSFVSDGYRRAYENLYYFIRLYQPSREILIVFGSVIIFSSAIIYAAVFSLISVILSLFVGMI